MQTGNLYGPWLGIAGRMMSCAMSMACGGLTSDPGKQVDAGGTVSIDAARDPALGDRFDADSIGARAIAEFEAALRAFCKCRDNDQQPDLHCYDWATRFQGENRDCYVAFLDRHAAEGLAACVFENAKSIGDCLLSCSAQCNGAVLTDDSPLHDIVFDLCHPPPSYFEETRQCSGP